MLGIINGEEALTADHLPYTYLPASHVARIASTFGSAEGGRRIWVGGSGFAELAGLARLKEPHIQNINIFKIKFVFNF